jgi:hypothetical protein
MPPDGAGALCIGRDGLILGACPRRSFRRGLRRVSRRALNVPSAALSPSMREPNRRRRYISCSRGDRPPLDSLDISREVHPSQRRCSPGRDAGPVCRKPSAFLAASYQPANFYAGPGGRGNRFGGRGIVDCSRGGPHWTAFSMGGTATSLDGFACAYDSVDSVGLSASLSCCDCCGLALAAEMITADQRAAQRLEGDCQPIRWLRGNRRAEVEAGDC